VSSPGKGKNTKKKTLKIKQDVVQKKTKRHVMEILIPENDNETDSQNYMAKQKKDPKKLSSHKVTAKDI
jgi:hypothetical protein